MKRLFAAAVAVVMSVGCGPSLTDEFRNGLPTRDMVEVKTPNATSGSQKLGTIHAGLEGERSDSYTMTRGATSTINGGTLFILALIKGITEHRPTTVEENRAVWGPHTGSLEANTWKLTVTRSGDESFSYALEAKDKNAGDETYVVVVSGTHTSTGEATGSGTFLVDFDAAQTLPEHGDEVGTAEVTYSRSENDEVSVAAEFRRVHDGHGGRDDFSYRYGRTPGEGGTFEFLARRDLHSEPELSLPEKFTVKSRWTEEGAGRSDYQVSEGNLDSAITGNECWDISFNSRYRNASWDSSLNYGDEQADCAFTSAEYSSL